MSIPYEVELIYGITYILWYFLVDCIHHGSCAIYTKLSWLYTSWFMFTPKLSWPAYFLVFYRHIPPFQPLVESLHFWVVLCPRWKLLPPNLMLIPLLLPRLDLPVRVFHFAHGHFHSCSIQLMFYSTRIPFLWNGISIPFHFVRILFHVESIYICRAIWLLWHYTSY